MGVSRSPEKVRKAVDEALAGFYIMDELQDTASRVIAEFTGAQAATVVHCASAAITLAVAASITGRSAEKIQALPDTRGMANRVVLPVGHMVDYGHSIIQDIRLAGGLPVPAGSEKRCTIEQLDAAMSDQSTACLLLVSSRLVRGAPVPLNAAVAAAHSRDLPAVIDGAAQDMRIDELLATGADLVLISAQKYLAAPTAGLVIGRSDLVQAVRAQEKGIGRAMKATKEGVLGALAALSERQGLDLSDWRCQQEKKVSDFVLRTGRLAGVSASAVPDRAGLKFPRAKLQIDPARGGKSAGEVADELRGGNPSVWVMQDDAERGSLVLELVPLDEEEIETIVARLAVILAA